MNSIITLTTDFGSKDGYVAQMKGVILGIHSTVTLVDVTHEITPFHVLEAALVLKGIAPYFPWGTVHVGVVDPGVGTERRAIVAYTDGQFYVGPDNGIFSLVLGTKTKYRIHQIVKPSLMLPKVHSTFHGRDIFAPAAARMAQGFPIEEVGPVVSDPVLLNVPSPTIQNSEMKGQVIHVDRFGNLFTNIRSTELKGSIATMSIAGMDIPVFGRCFGDGHPGQLMGIINSFGYLEIAINGENASAKMNLGIGSSISIVFN